MLTEPFLYIIHLLPTNIVVSMSEVQNAVTSMPISLGCVQQLRLGLVHICYV